LENQEDSVVVNQTSVGRGLFNAAFYNYEKAELEKNEDFGNPDYARTMDIKKDATYEFVKDRAIEVGTEARRGHVLIVKSAKIAKPENEYLYVDKSIVYKKDEPMYVERVVHVRNDEDAEVIKVKLRANRPIAIGDKLASRSGNKGICTIKHTAADMPVCEDGTIPDIIVNAHSIPTRMAVNQILECVLGQLASRRGSHIDATSFRTLDIDGICKELESYGIKYDGNKRMYNGRTGLWIDTMIFVGPTTYQRLQKYVADEHYASMSGPTSALTRQPLDGGFAVGVYKKQFSKSPLVTCNQRLDYKVARFPKCGNVLRALKYRGSPVMTIAAAGLAACGISI
jgi:DNA-directed RNA polymerase II subunit RPB2